MKDSKIDIKKIFVLPVDSTSDNLLAFIRIELSCGLFLNELRLFPDEDKTNGVYLVYPTRTHSNGVTKFKTYYPVNDSLRSYIQAEVHKAYVSKLEALANEAIN